MNWSAIVGIAQRDIRAALRSPGVVVPMIVVPVVFVVVFPLAAYGTSRMAFELQMLGQILEMVPADTLAGLPESQGVRLGVVLATYAFPPLLVVVPLLVASVLATDAIAGERERGTLEGLLLAPLSDRELFAGKVLGPLVPALVVGLIVPLVYAIFVNVLFWSEVGSAVLPNLPWLLIVLWFGPAFTAAALGFTVLISARSESVQGASQIAGVAVLPLLLIAVSQLGGFILLEWWVTLVAGAVMWALTAVLIPAGARSLARDRQATSLG